MKYTRNGDVYFLSGAVDASDAVTFASFAKAVTANPPPETGLRLNLGGLQNFATGAVRAWMECKAILLSHAGGKLLVEDCSSSFIDFANIYAEAIQPESSALGLSLARNSRVSIHSRV